MNNVELGQMAETLKLLGDNTRLTIVAALKERELCVCELVDALQTSQPNVSQHMRKLKAGGLVKERKRGQWVYYSLNVEDRPYLHPLLDRLPSLKDTIDQACGNSNCCD
jgi:Predicted transcriptional regulators